jgi:hypothetical protein
MGTTTPVHPRTDAEPAGSGRRRARARRRDTATEIVLEFPDFGFGPAATALQLVPQLAAHWRCAVASTGVALDLARRTFPDLPCLDVDTFRDEHVPRFGGLVDRDAFVLSVTNPSFAAWALDAGYRVGVLDTLHWLWDDAAPSVDGAEFHVVQRYWGPRGDEAPRGAVLATADTLAALRIRRNHRETRRALVTFGGMGLPLDPQLPLDVARWTLGAVVPVLLAHDAVEGVDVVGGHPGLAAACAETARDPRVRCLGFLPPRCFRELLDTAAVVVATPGIATLHELQQAHRRTLLLPGENMSQLLQLRDAIDAFGARHAFEWPEAARLAETLRGMPEHEGVALVARHARAAMGPDTTAGLAQTAASVLAARRPSPILGQRAYSPELPSVTDAVLRCLRTRVRKRGKKRGREEKPIDFASETGKMHQPAVR